MEKIKKASTSIKFWNNDDKPREKMIEEGVGALSNSELLAIIINNGQQNRTAIQIAKDVMRMGSDNLNELGKFSWKDLLKINGIGKAKAITISAALELGRRRQGTAILEKIRITNSQEIAGYLQTALKDFSYEVFAVVFLNRANKIKSFQMISKGGLTGTVADPRIILKKAIEEEATSLVLVHNHPSGNLKPSRADEELTQKIRLAASYMDILVLDHIIVSEEGYFSFADEGLL